MNHQPIRVATWAWIAAGLWTTAVLVALELGLDLNAQGGAVVLIVFVGILGVGLR